MGGKTDSATASVHCVRCYGRLIVEYERGPDVTSWREPGFDCPFCGYHNPLAVDGVIQSVKKAPPS